MARAYCDSSQFMIRKFADLITEKADELAEIEVRDNGKLIAEMSAQCKYRPVVLLLCWALRQDRRVGNPDR